MWPLTWVSKLPFELVWKSQYWQVKGVSPVCLNMCAFSWYFCAQVKLQRWHLVRSAGIYLFFFLFLWMTLTWTLKAFFVLHLNGHNWHSIVILSACTLIWSSKWLGQTVLKLQSWHKNPSDCFLLCVLIWLLKSALRAKALPHSSHLWTFSILSLLCRETWSLNLFLPCVL